MVFPDVIFLQRQDFCHNASEKNYPMRTCRNHDTVPYGRAEQCAQGIYWDLLSFPIDTI